MHFVRTSPSGSLAVLPPPFLVLEFQPSGSRLHSSLELSFHPSRPFSTLGENSGRATPRKFVLSRRIGYTSRIWIEKAWLLPRVSESKL